MKKQLLTLAFFVGMLGIACPGMEMAAPAGSTEEADRQFLKELEASGAATSHEAKPAASPAPAAKASGAPGDEEAAAGKAPSKAEARAKKTSGAARVSSPVRRLGVEGARLVRRILGHLP